MSHRGTEAQRHGETFVILCLFLFCAFTAKYAKDTKKDKGCAFFG